MFVEPVDDTIETLREYAEQKMVDEFDIEPWPDEVDLGAETDGESVREYYDQFQRWADREGTSLEPGFLHRERTTLVSDSPDRVLTPPVVCLAIRVDGELVRVAPHSTGTTAYTVEDALADIEAFSGEHQSAT
jgi:hypothetical protein